MARGAPDGFQCALDGTTVKQLYTAIRKAALPRRVDQPASSLPLRAEAEVRKAGGAPPGSPRRLARGERPPSRWRCTWGCRQGRARRGQEWSGCCTRGISTFRLVLMVLGTRSFGAFSGVQYGSLEDCRGVSYSGRRH